MSLWPDPLDMRVAVKEGPGQSKENVDAPPAKHTEEYRRSRIQGFCAWYFIQMLKLTDAGDYEQPL
jgi:hypothetical protein